jgi:hypothetical protein
MKLTACVTLIAFVLCSCTTLKPVKISQPANDEVIQAKDLVHKGDSVRITTKDGKVYSFKVKSLIGNMIYGKGVTIDTRNISKVEINKNTIVGDAAKGIGNLIYGVAVGLLILALIIYVPDNNNNSCCGN